MGHVLVKEGVVVQKSCSPEEGFIFASDEVVCGYLFINGEFVAPPLSAQPREEPPNPLTVVDRIIADPAELAKLKAALGL